MADIHWISRLGLPDLDVVALQADLVGGDGIVGDTALLGLAGPDVERRRVPGAGDDVAFELTFRQRTAGVRAGVVEGAIDVGDGYLFTVSRSTSFMSPGARSVVFVTVRNSDTASPPVGS